MIAIYIPPFIYFQAHWQAMFAQEFMCNGTEEFSLINTVHVATTQPPIHNAMLETTHLQMLWFEDNVRTPIVANP